MTPDDILLYALISHHQRSFLWQQIETDAFPLVQTHTHTHTHTHTQRGGGGRERSLEHTTVNEMMSPSNLFFRVQGNLQKRRQKESMESSRKTRSVKVNKAHMKSQRLKQQTQRSQVYTRSSAYIL
jgi:hypothetical protein